MTDVTIATANQAQKWRKKYIAEYVRALRFKDIMGKGPGSPIQVVQELGVGEGKSITFPLIDRLSGSAVVNDSELEGNEEAMVNTGHEVTVNMRRNAVRHGKYAQQMSAFDVYSASKDVLKSWDVGDTRDLILNAALSPVVDGLTAYASASETEKDTWLEDNQDRVLFGELKSNLDTTGGAVGADHSDSLATCDTTDDKFDAAKALTMRRMAMEADPYIRPFQIDDESDEDVFFVLCGSRTMRDLRADSTIQQANRDAGFRGDKNRLFKGGRLYYEGLIFQEVPEIPVLTGVGAASADVQQVVLLGAQALGFAVAQQQEFKMEVFDYGAKKGCAVEKIIGIEKLMKGNVQHGIVTGYFAAPADS